MGQAVETNKVCFFCLDIVVTYFYERHMTGAIDFKRVIDTLHGSATKEPKTVALRVPWTDKHTIKFSVFQFTYRRVDESTFTVNDVVRTYDLQAHHYLYLRVERQGDVRVLVSFIVTDLVVARAMKVPVLWKRYCQPDARSIEVLNKNNVSWIDARKAMDTIRQQYYLTKTKL